MEKDTTNNLISEALLELEHHGYGPGEIIVDGTIHRFGPKQAQWYIAFENLVPSSNAPYLNVVYGDWTTGEKQHFRSQKITLTPEDRVKIKEQQQRAQEEARKYQQKLHEETALECQKKWETLSTTDLTPYLEKKQIAELFGARIQEQNLYVPIRDEHGKLWSLQTIQPNSDKLFWPGGKKQGCCHVIGNIEQEPIIYVAEGFATAASIHMAIKKPVAVAFDAGNLEPVARALKVKYPEKNLIICGDDDRWKEINTGRDKAKKAAKQVFGAAIFPVFKEETLKKQPTDFNDLHCFESLQAVADQLSQPVEFKSRGEQAGQAKRASQATILVALCDDVEFFHTPEEETYATVPVDKHKETRSLRSTEFKQWLLRRYYQETGSAPGAQAVQDALAVLASRARFDGKEQEVFLRVGEHRGNVYVDLGNECWQVVEVTPSGWKIIDNPPVKFRRSRGMLPLPTPIKEAGTEPIAELRNFLNVETGEDFKLITAWLMNAYNPSGPYLVLVLYGEQGSAKSTTVKVIRALVDPNTAPLRREPRSSDDLMVSTKGNWAVAIDNMSHLSDWLSDDFCRLATGGGLSKRQLYTDDDEVVLNATRPIILNGIDEFVARGDLASRAIILNLPIISDDERKREKVFWSRFEQARPRLLGAVLTGISTALANQNTFELDGNLRMADSWHWASAAEPAFGWSRGEIVKAFRLNQLKANDVVLTSSPLTSYIRQLAAQGWTGTPEELLSKLNSMRSPTDTEWRSWPVNAKVLTDRIRRLNPALRIAGITVEFTKTAGSNSQRLVTIRKSENFCDASDAPSDEGNSRDASDAGNLAYSNGMPSAPFFDSRDSVPPLDFNDAP